MSRKNKPAIPPKFAAGDRVRIKPGVADPDYPDLPLGGWAGEVVEIEQGNPPMYLIRWNQQTLDTIHPVYRQRAERDGFEFGESWQSEADLLPDTGEPAPIEQPASIRTRPLLPGDQDDRVRAAIGITGDQALPDVTEELLVIYHGHPAARLTFPFEAEYSAETGPMGSKSFPVTVLALLDPQEYGESDDGLFCEARHGKRIVLVPLSELEVPRGKPNHHLVGDFSYWFWNYQ